jgi:3-dehydroquinate synthase
MRGLRSRRLKAPYLMLPDGERFKTMHTVELCYDWLLEQQADRQSILVILGGGVIGDTGGFVAATYLRGIRYVQVPTTLVSQVDSSVGGKVGVDHKEGKNLIGAFYQPQYVHIDVGYLEKLPEREYLCGLAEVIKYAVICDRSLFQFLQKKRIEILRRHVAELEHIVETCCRIKADVVEQDEKEMSGLRMILNFGHTVGHAIERLTEYKKYRHGEAVAMGMIAAAKLSVSQGYCTAQTAQMIHDMVASYGLPTQWPRFSKRQWQQSLLRDKKMRGKVLHFVFVETLGKVSVNPIEPKDVVRAIT